MAKFNARLAGIILAFLLSVSGIKAQYVFIPDQGFLNYLLSSGFGSAINGDSLLITSPLVTSLQIMDCSNRGITSLEGVEYFTGLKQLDCSSNSISAISVLPDSLLYLNVQNVGLTSLPGILPPRMLSLHCSNNQLMQLPLLPSTLQVLYCESNQLTSLPSLPNNLSTLDCSGNQLTVLPSLPNNLAMISCLSNQLTSIPPLPNSLVNFDCSYNSLVNLPVIPTSIRYLACISNQISQLPVLPDSLNSLHISQNPIHILPSHLPTYLRSLWCSMNQLDSLPVLPDSLVDLKAGNNSFYSVPTLPEGIVYVNLSGNHLSQISSFPTSLVYLYLSDNSFDSIPLLPPSLQTLHVISNHLHSIPSLPSTLIELKCDSNPIHFLPSIPSGLMILTCTHDSLQLISTLPNTLSTLNCSWNQITEIKNLPYSMSILNISVNPIACLPPIHSLTEFLWSGTQIHCLPNIITVTSFNCFPSITNVPICEPFVDCPIDWSISGFVYEDLNGDCVQDSTDIPLSNVKMLLDSSGVTLQSCFTNSFGMYAFATGQGSYSVRLDSMYALNVNCPVSGFYTSQISASDSVDDQLNFSLSCSSGFDLVANSVSALSQFRIGRTTEVSIRAGDYSQLLGTSCYNGPGVIDCILNGAILYQGPAPGSVAPQVLSIDTLRWVVNDISASSINSDYKINVGVLPGANLQNPVCFYLSIYPTIGDLNTNNNTETFCFPVVGSFDPNEKLIMPSGSVDTSDHAFNFTIFFQNTGNAPAEDIYIIDTLDNDLDASTFEFLSSTHSVVTQMLPGNILRFNFHGINLIDSVTNESLSHGNVQFRIHRKVSTGMGTEITNTAYIYFDQNAPVATNEVYAIVTSLVNVQSIKEQTAFVYPNPAFDQVTIRANGENIISAEILDVAGKSIAYLKGSNHSEMQIDLKSLSSGIYFAKIKTKNGGVVCRFIKSEY